MARQKFTLQLTEDERRALHALLDGRGQSRKITRDVLARLLTDHQRLLTLLADD